MIFLLLLTLLASGCSDDASPVDGALDRDAAARIDGATPDASLVADAAAIDSAVADASFDSATVDARADIDAGPFDPGTAYGSAATLGTVGGPLVEVSGIVASGTQAGVFWVHNDSGGGPVFYAIDRSADTLATFTISGATAEDWEDIAISGDVLYLANVGDNMARTTDGASGRAGIQLYRVVEPDAAGGDATLTADRIELRYPSRPYDCESVFVDHATGDVYLVTKEAPPAEVFVARAPLAAGTPRTLEHVGTLDFDYATAADASRDGSRFVVRGYGAIRIYDRAPGETPIEALGGTFLTTPSPSAAEAIAFEADGWGLYTIAEGGGATLFYIPWE